jgi:hypothetical protein
LRAGQFGRVSVPTEQAAVPHVPSAAVFQRGQLEYVVVIVGGRAQLRIIRSGKRVGQDIEVVSGLEVGEKVVGENPDRVREGQSLEEAP